MLFYRVMETPRPPWIPYAVVGLLALAVGLQTLSFGFVFDDEHLIVGNRFLLEAWSPVRAFAHDFWYGTRFGEGYYRPLVVASLALNGRVLGWEAAGFHLFNLLLHALNASLVLLLARRLRLPPIPALIAACLFAAHPIAAWPVASIVARVDLLPVLFVILAWIACASDPTAPGMAGSLRQAAGVGFCFFLALLCKESAVAFLAIPLLGLRRLEPPGADRANLPRPRSTRGIAAACGVALAAWLALRALVGVRLAIPLDSISPLANPLAFLPFPDRILAALRLAGRYLLYLVLPWRFSDAACYGPMPDPFHLTDPGVILGAIILGAWGAAILTTWLRRDRLCLPLALALAGFLPASNLLTPIGSLYAQNFLYLPLLGTCLAIGELAARLAARSPGRPWIIAWAAAPIIAVLAIGAFREAKIWGDELSLFEAWTSRFPRYAMAQGRLGLALQNNGRPAEAEAALRKALAMEDRNAEAHYNLGVALALNSPTKERLEEALEHTLAAIDLMPEIAEPRVNASKILLLLERPAEAERAARGAIEIQPDLMAARLNLAESLFRQSRYDAAANEFALLSRLSPGDPNVRSPYIVSLIHAGRLDEARHEIASARSDFPDVVYFEFCLARVEARSGHQREALALLKESAARSAETRHWISEVNDFDSYHGDPGFRVLAGK